VEVQSGIDLTGKVAVVTGAGRGIGAAIAGAFAEAAADIIVADLNNESAQRTADRLSGVGRKALAVTADVGVPAQVGQLFDIVRAEFGRLDILVNNAGVWFRKPFLEISDSEWDLVLTTNLKGTFLCTQNAARIMMPQKHGCIINIASHAGLFYSRGQGAHYAASKAGIIQLTRVLAFELGPFQIRINAIAPGGTNAAESSAAKPEATLNRESGSNPLGRRGEPEDIAHAALFLASPMASFITGQTLVVNGGSIGQS
jgi:NAD(P)-dependent dehydrogenase (short-subunit alcohol dehydrogenase family)